jgi:squalene-hopene/tetraprenyl-beta-curcumene cyclase
MAQWRSNAALAEPDVLPTRDLLDQTIAEAAAWLAGRQAADGHWVFELEADATIPAEYIFVNHFLGDLNPAIEQKIANYLRRTQGQDGGWPLFFDGEADLSASVKAYYALKLVGEDPEAPHMIRARDYVLANGGAASSSVFTRIMLALFGEVPWRATPWIPVEAMLLPKWSPFTLEKVSYWSRTCMVPLFILATLKPQACNPRGINARELFTVPPEQHGHYLSNPTGTVVGEALLRFDRVARKAEPLIPRVIQKAAIKQAVAFIKERLNGEDGLGGIFPAMSYALMAMHTLGVGKEHPDRLVCRSAIDRMIVERDHEAYVQPCMSPVWDSALALHALMESGESGSDPTVANACRWLEERQVLDVKGDWAVNRPDVRPGGWAFQYRNDYYPDVDDTAVVVMALDRASSDGHRHAIDRGTEWVRGMQSTSGGWGAFDVDNEHYALNNIPFADHGALLDPPSADVSARCVGMLAQIGYGREHPAVARALRYLHDQQEQDGSWFGRWGTNYIYGTWSVLVALNAVGEDMNAPYVRRAAAWLKARQRADGGWGEDCATYWPECRGDEAKASTPSQTAWALLGLMAAGEVGSDAVQKGVEYLLTAPRDGGKWREEYYNAVGFPKVFYLRYYGYSAYFPLWALARYRRLTSGDPSGRTLGC